MPVAISGKELLQQFFIHKRNDFSSLECMFQVLIQEFWFKREIPTHSNIHHILPKPAVTNNPAKGHGDIQIREEQLLDHNRGLPALQESPILQHANVALTHRNGQLLQIPEAGNKGTLDLLPKTEQERITLQFRRTALGECSAHLHLWAV